MKTPISKRRQKLAFLIIMSFIFVPFQLAGQPQLIRKTDTYSILRNGEKIGEALTQLIDNGDQHSYIMSTQIMVRIIFKINVTVVYQNDFNVQNILEKSKYVQRMNGLTQKDVKLLPSKSGYELLNHGKNMKTLAEPITFTALRLYFEEPKNIHRVFSENQMKYVSINSKGDGRYELVQSNGRITTYQYENGKLFSLDSSSIYGTISIVHQKTSNYASN